MVIRTLLGACGGAGLVLWANTAGLLAPLGGLFSKVGDVGGEAMGNTKDKLQLELHLLRNDMNALMMRSHAPTTVIQTLPPRTSILTKGVFPRLPRRPSHFIICLFWMMFLAWKGGWSSSARHQGSLRFGDAKASPWGLWCSDGATELPIINFYLRRAAHSTGTHRKTDKQQLFPPPRGTPLLSECGNPCCTFFFKFCCPHSKPTSVTTLFCGCALLNPIR